MSTFISVFLTIFAVLSVAYLILEILASRYPDQDDEHEHIEDVRG